MSGIFKDYHVGIDYGTSNSCVGIYMNGTVQIAPNKIGERITPSIVCFTEDNKGKALVGEENLNQKLDYYKNTIYEVKRFIGLNYEEFIEEDYGRNLNYEIVNQDGIPKIKVNLNGSDMYYSAEEISSLIIKKMVQCAEDFIAETEPGIKLTKAIITVPAHFRDDQKNAVKNAAKLAGIDVPRIINEPTAAALAYGIGHNLSPEISNPSLKKIKTLHNSVVKKDGDAGEAPLAIEIMKSKSQENAIVFDLGGGTLDITILNISKNSEGIINFEVESTDGDTHLGGSDFDNKLIDFCIKDFCIKTGNKEEMVRQDKKSCKRLKIKCENAKKLLTVTQQTIINIENFYGKDDLFLTITREKFDELCKDLYIKIRDLIYQVMEDIGKSPSDIDEVILVGGATRMVGVKDLLHRIFGEGKVKNNLDPDEAVAFGATMEAAKMEEKDKIDFVLQDITAYKLGIATENKDPNDKKENGDKMYSIIKKFSKIPSSSEKTFEIELNQNYPNIDIRIFEGNDNYIKNNTSLGVMHVDNINRLGKIEYKVKFSVDVNSQLTVTITIDSLGIKKEEIIKKVTHAYVDNKKKKIKICKNKNLQPFSILLESIKMSKQKLSESFNIQNKLENLKDCCQNIEKIIEHYMQFIKDNESIYEKIYTNTKELFGYYIELIKLDINKKDEIKEIVQKIKQYMNNLITQVGYSEELLEDFTEIQQREELKNVFYEIFINYMELMNEQGLIKKKYEKFSRYYSKLYFEREFYTCKKYVKENDILKIDKSLRERYEELKKKNEEELKKVNSFANFIEQKVKSGKFMYGKTGFTIVGKKIEEYEKDISSLSIDDLREILDIFQSMVDSFDKKDNSIGEAYCLFHLIYINNKIFKKGYDDLFKYLERLKSILFSKDDEEYDWIKEAKIIIKELEQQKKTNQ